MIETIVKACFALGPAQIPLPVSEEEVKSLATFACANDKAQLALKASLQGRFAIERKSLIGAARTPLPALKPDAPVSEFKFDFLDLARNEALKSYLSKNESRSSTVLFSDEVCFVVCFAGLVGVIPCFALAYNPIDIVLHCLRAQILESSPE